MQKKDSLTSALPKALTDSYRCGECLHWEAHRHSDHEKICKDEGIKAGAVAPSCYTPDATQLCGNSDQFVQFVTLFRNWNPKQRRIATALLRQKKKQYEPGQKFYFCVGTEYVSNYLVGYVAGYTSKGQVILIGSPDRQQRGKSFTMYMPPESIESGSLLTFSQWKQKRASLREQGLVFDPSNKVIKKSSVVEAYEPPSLDAVPEWFLTKDEAPAEGKATRRRKRTDEIAFNV
ncbi:hypothetical protein BcepSauron_161 [Burkholderia phage BcepSauron]|uniref:Uncharacterized protein n=2 Tax=Sarumanvirus TaxID=2843450 RepID=A0A482MKH2_9CAUD|nr:DNA topoisomerase [Burkholderia phage BcepSaruman]YP_009904539.1 DNA topoisomerase [Burkholderia phage BcepSauron]QBQ74541.1 hypothetical protein BcepSauron_161 [Burkholderia phage BcepSauron]QBX06574.1 hypothetical protein BcepSaruman_161 [Burkholderia phage BcepSaruman]